MTLQYAAKDQQFINLREPVAGRAGRCRQPEGSPENARGGVSVITAGEAMRVRALR